jgi:hypothetical protein
MTSINCAEACINGCVLGDECPNSEYKSQASKFIEETSLDRMIEMAQAALLKKMTQPPQWILPDEEQP